MPILSICRAKRTLQRDLFFLLLIFVLFPTILFSDSNQKYRPYSLIDVTLNEREDLAFLDSKINTYRLERIDLDKIIKIVNNSHSSVVVCHAINVLGNQQDLPEDIIRGVSSLSTSENWNIRLSLTNLLGWFGKGTTFPDFYKLLMDRNPSIAQNSRLYLYRFPIESLAGLPEFSNHLPHNPEMIAVCPSLSNYFLKIFNYSFHLVSIGNSFLFWQYKMITFEKKDEFFTYSPIIPILENCPQATQPDTPDFIFSTNCIIASGQRPITSVPGSTIGEVNLCNSDIADAVVCLSSITGIQIRYNGPKGKICNFHIGSVKALDAINRFAKENNLNLSIESSEIILTPQN